MELFTKGERRVAFRVLCFAVLGLLSTLSWIVYGIYLLA